MHLSHRIWIPAFAGMTLVELALLSEIRATTLTVADFSKIAG